VSYTVLSRYLTKRTALGFRCDRVCRWDAQPVTQGNDGSIFEKALAFYGHIEANRIHGVAIITVDYAAPLTSPAYDVGATEEQVEDRFARRLEELHGWTILSRGTTDSQS
jgi:hypothetical protein